MEPPCCYDFFKETYVVGRDGLGVASFCYELQAMRRGLASFPPVHKEPPRLYVLERCKSSGKTQPYLVHLAPGELSSYIHYE